MGSRKPSFLLAIAALLALTACEGAVTLEQVAGHYEGFVVAHAADGSSAEEHSSASAEIQTTGVASLSVRLRSEEGAADAVIEARLGARGRTMQLSSSTGFFPGQLELTNSRGNCYADDAKDQLCLGGREIQFVLASLGTKIVLDKMPVAAVPAKEPPQNYSIDQLVERTRNANFDNQVEFENVVQARLTARNAYLNLLPHINVGTALSGGSAVLGSIPAAILTMVRSIGDLLPFVLPTRWYQAEADAARSTAERDAYRIVQASSINIVKGLALSVLRDEESLERMEEIKLSMIEVRDEILSSEHNGAGDLQIGSADQLNIVINGLERSMSALKEALREERTALSQGAGFMNPDAVAMIEPVAVAPVTGPLPGELSDWQNLALKRSVNVAQMDDLAVYAQKMKVVRKFQWLDPAGDDSGSLGFGIVDYLAIGNSMVRQVYDKKRATESLLLKKVQDTLTSSSQIFDDYRLQASAVDINQRLIDRYRSNFHSNIAFNMSDLANALQGKAAAELAKIGDEYAALVLQDAMDFLTFSGAYAQLLVGNH